MEAEEVYNETKQITDDLVVEYCNLLQDKNGGRWDSKEMPKYAPMDYMIFNNGQLHHYLEVKCRKHKYLHYNNEKVPVSKYTFGYTFEKTRNIKSYLLIKWEDKVGITNLSNPAGVGEMVARYDRGAGKDLYAYYDYDQFKLLQIWFI